MKASRCNGLLAPEVRLFHSADKCRRYVERHLSGEIKLYGTDGQMIYDSGVAVVLMAHRGDRATEESLLVHEAYHAAVAHMRWLGEDQPGEEVMAYLVQTIADGLIRAHDRWRTRKGLI